MVTCYEDKRYASILRNIGCASQEVIVRTAAAVVTLVLIDVTKTEDDAGLRHEVRFGSESGCILGGLTHVDNVVHDSGHVFLAGAVMSAALIDMAVGEEDSAEPDVLLEAETVGFVVISKDLQFAVVELGSRGVRGD